jgi:hypothetical protein
MPRTLDVSDVRDALADAAQNWWAAPDLEVQPNGFTLTTRDGMHFVVTIRRASPVHPLTDHA